MENCDGSSVNPDSLMLNASFQATVRPIAPFDEANPQTKFEMFYH
jgi:hypothetical protein